MSEAETKSKREMAGGEGTAVWSPEPSTRDGSGRRLRVFPVLITLATVAVAGALGWAMWNAYMGAPWRGTAPCASMSSETYNGLGPMT